MDYDFYEMPKHNYFENFTEINLIELFLDNNIEVVILQTLDPIEKHYLEFLILFLGRKISIKN